MYKIFILGFLLLTPRALLANCVDPQSFINSTVSIARYHRSGGEVMRNYGSSWFYLSPKILVTNAHVAEILFLSSKWNEIEIMQTGINGKKRVEYNFARVINIGNVGYEKTSMEDIEELLLEDVAVLELKKPFQGAQVLQLAERTLKPSETFVSVSYPYRELTLTKGFSIEPTNGSSLDKEYKNMVHLVSPFDPLAFYSGASGSPILNCNGKVAAISNLFRFFINDSVLRPAGYAIPITSLIQSLQRKKR